MLNIHKLIEGFEAADARSALYYVSRYIKQAESFDEYKKDIFEDERQSAPSQAVRSLAVIIIKAIEAHEGSKAADVAFDRIVELLDHISSVERNLGFEFTDAELASAEEFTSGIVPPPIR